MLGQARARRPGPAGRSDEYDRDLARRTGAGGAGQPRLSSCARHATAISAGSFPATPSSTRRNTAGPSRSRACARRSSPTSSTTIDPKRERCWIAEMNGENVGCVMLVKDDVPGVARLRLLLVDPKARGLGLGTRLVDECVHFARASRLQERSRCGRTAFSPPHVAFMKMPASPSPQANRATPGARTSSPSSGIWSCEAS